MTTASELSVSSLLTVALYFAFAGGLAGMAVSVRTLISRPAGKTWLVCAKASALNRVNIARNRFEAFMVNLRGILMQREHLAVVAESNVDPGFNQADASKVVVTGSGDGQHTRAGQNTMRSQSGVYYFSIRHLGMI